MSAELEQLNEASLRHALGADAALLDVRVFAELDSTNTEAKRQIARGIQKPLLIVAESQSAGRGRMGRSFYSPAKSGVYFSLLFQSREPISQAVALTGAAAVAVMRAVRACTGKQCAIKWVNDLYLNGKKVCGILAESAVLQGSAPYIVLGIGINLFTSDFPAELESVAGALGTEPISRAKLIARVCRELRRFIEDPDDRSWLADYRAHSCVIGQPINWTEAGVSHDGVATGIDENGGLEVLGRDGERRTLSTGEISVRMMPS